VADDNILLVINLQGIQILENAKRDRIVHHLDYEDLLYVMGKGNRLKIGFQYNMPLLQQGQGNDCRTELFTGNVVGFKARVVAEDIVAYMQLRLAEMTKNDAVEYASRPTASALLDPWEPAPRSDEPRLKGTDPAQQDPNAARTSPTAARNYRERANSFKGLEGLQIDQGDLLDSDDLENDHRNSLVLDLGPVRSTERKTKSSADQYRKAIAA